MGLYERMTASDMTGTLGDTDIRLFRVTVPEIGPDDAVLSPLLGRWNAGPVGPYERGRVYLCSWPLAADGGGCHLWVHVYELPGEGLTADRCGDFSLIP